MTMTDIAEPSDRAFAEAPVLSVESLKVTYYTDAGRAKALDDVSFTLRAGENFIAPESIPAERMKEMPQAAVVAGLRKFTG